MAKKTLTRLICTVSYPLSILANYSTVDTFIVIVQYEILYFVFWYCMHHAPTNDIDYLSLYYCTVSHQPLFGNRRPTTDDEQTKITNGTTKSRVPWKLQYNKCGGCSTCRLFCV